jgi:hypothetical protein
VPCSLSRPSWPPPGDGDEQVPHVTCTFRQRDLTRALRAAEAAGRAVHRVEIDRDGKLVLVMMPSSEDHPEDERPPDEIVL